VIGVTRMMKHHMKGQHGPNIEKNVWELLKGFLYNIFGHIHRVVYKGTSEAR
jgi:hypothetical protein